MDDWEYYEKVAEQAEKVAGGDLPSQLDGEITEIDFGVRGELSDNVEFGHEDKIMIVDFSVLLDDVPIDTGRAYYTISANPASNLVRFIKTYKKKPDIGVRVKVALDRESNRWRIII